MYPTKNICKEYNICLSITCTTHIYLWLQFQYECAKDVQISTVYSILSVSKTHCCHNKKQSLVLSCSQRHQDSTLDTNPCECHLWSINLIRNVLYKFKSFSPQRQSWISDTPKINICRIQVKWWADCMKVTVVGFAGSLLIKLCVYKPGSFGVNLPA